MAAKLVLTSWYINLARSAELLGSDRLRELANEFGDYRGTAFITEPVQMARTKFKEELQAWIISNQVQSLGQLASQRKLKVGAIFTLYHDFYGRGLSRYSNPTKRIPRNALAELYCTLRGIAEGKRVLIKYHPGGLTTNSAWHRLGGHTRLFVFGYVEAINKDTILVRPYLIADINTGVATLRERVWNHHRYGEIHVDSIDSFSQISVERDSDRKTPNLAILKKIPEAQIKKAFAEIIGEPNCPKDWGGEQSDLFSTMVKIEKKRISTAFLFKGPAHFQPLTPAGLGKNGDQISRLFHEPAELLVLQHCHKVESSVRETMRAFAGQVSKLRQFCIIDGYDTIRLLRAYKKCGLR